MAVARNPDASLLEQLELVTAERDDAIRALADLHTLIDRGAYLTESKQQIVRAARALLIRHGRVLDEHERAIAQWRIREAQR